MQNKQPRSYHDLLSIAVENSLTGNDSCQSPSHSNINKNGEDDVGPGTVGARILDCSVFVLLMSYHAALELTRKPK